MAALIPTGRRRRLLLGRPRRSGSSFTAGGRLTTPFFPSLPLLLTPSLTPLHTSPCLKHPDRGPIASLQRGRRHPGVAHAAAVAAGTLRSTHPPIHPIRPSHSCKAAPCLMRRSVRTSPRSRKCNSAFLQPVLCSPGGPSNQWLCPQRSGSRQVAVRSNRKGRSLFLRT